METSYFLGANSAKGFFSFYKGFCHSKGDFLHIIKGGPGTGKSGFMRAISREARSRSLDTELVLCSGDPASLDGVYIPALHLGFVDGTAPHVGEPEIFGVDCDYVNLSHFCRTPLSPAEQVQARELTQRYRGKYQRAYALITAAECCRTALLPPVCSEDTQRRIELFLAPLLEQIGPSSAIPSTSQERFLSCISCEGIKNELSSLQGYETLFALDDSCALASRALGYILQRFPPCERRCIVARSPLDASTPVAVLFPGASVAFFSSSLGHVDGARRVHLDRLLGDETHIKAVRRSVRAARRECSRQLHAACSILAEAKALHDELEKIYIENMNFPALDAFTADVLGKLFP